MTILPPALPGRGARGRRFTAGYGLKTTLKAPSSFFWNVS